MDVWLLHLPAHHNSWHGPEMCRGFHLPPSLLTTGETPPECDFHPSISASNPSNAEQKPGKTQQLSPGICGKVVRLFLGALGTPAFLPCSSVMPFPSGRGSKSCCWFSLHSRNPRKRCRIHWRERSHNNINSSCTALIQFAGKVNRSQNIPLFAQCLRNFPFLTFFKSMAHQTFPWHSLPPAPTLHQHNQFGAGGMWNRSISSPRCRKHSKLPGKPQQEFTTSIIPGLTPLPTSGPSTPAVCTEWCQSLPESGKDWR